MEPRLEELLERLTASGPKCNAVSCSETHEIVDLTIELEQKYEELVTLVTKLQFLIGGWNWSMFNGIIDDEDAIADLKLASSLLSEMVSHKYTKDDE